jgi:AbrB family looped-hinge helix DNA binding protein
MKLATSRITQQGQISIPAEVRRRLGLVPGSVIEWDAQGDLIIVRRVGTFSSLDIHHAVFGKQSPRTVTTEEMDLAVADYLKDKYARR